jgi:RNA polymerase sigma-70 factor (ECF subfamily)
MTANDSSPFDALLKATRAGDAQAREQLFELVSKFVFSHVKKQVLDHHDAQDLAQDVSRTVWERIDEVPVGRVEGWLCEVIRHKIGHHLRRKKFEKRLFDPLSDEVLVRPDHVNTQPDVIYEIKEFESLLEQLGPTLNPDEQQILSLLKEGVAQQEIIQRLGIPAGTLYSRIHRVRMKLEHARGGDQRKSPQR